MCVSVCVVVVVVIIIVVVVVDYGNNPDRRGRIVQLGQ